MTIQDGVYSVEGIRVLNTRPLRTVRTTSLLLVHGGCHGAWCWDKYLPYFASRGWDCHAFNWKGRGGSTELAEPEALSRSIEAVAGDIAVVAATFATPPVIIGHSMGGLATLKYAENNPYSGLVLLTPPPPKEVSPGTVDIVVDPAQLWGPPPFEVAKNLFFIGANEDETRRYYDMLVPESPRAVEQVVSNDRPSVDAVRISGPTLVVAAEKDVLSPPEEVRRLAYLLGADYRYVCGSGHGVMMTENWIQLAQGIHQWLASHFADSQKDVPSTPAQHFG